TDAVKGRPGVALRELAPLAPHSPPPCKKCCLGESRYWAWLQPLWDGGQRGCRGAWRSGQFLFNGKHAGLPPPLCIAHRPDLHPRATEQGEGFWHRFNPRLPCNRREQRPL